MFYFFKKRKVSKRKKLSKKKKEESRTEYLKHKELARAVVTGSLLRCNVNYNYIYNIVAIRDQKTRWGSCSSKGNLNFNYRLAMLPQHLVDYVVTHELCHLKEMNHSVNFWDLVALTIPDYANHRAELKSIKVS